MIFPVLQFRTSVAYARISTLPFLPVSSPKSLRELCSAVEHRHGKPEGRYHARISLYRVFKRCLEMPCFAKKRHRFLNRENLLVLRYASNIICVVTILDSVQTNGTFSTFDGKAILKYTTSSINLVSTILELNTYHSIRLPSKYFQVLVVIVSKISRYLSP